MLFGKKKKDEPQRPATIKEAMTQDVEEEDVEITEVEVSADEDEVVAGDEQLEETAEPDQAQEQPKVAPVAGTGPKDASELESTRGYLDFGALLVPAIKNQKVRLDIDQKTKRVVSLTIAVGQASIQLQAFSAPKSGGIWDEVRNQIQESVIKQKGRVRNLEGRFGTELHARVPTVLKDGRQGWRAARFIGFEGNRWFLRGVIGGRGAIDRKASAGVEELFSRIVVVRGDEPLPPRELLKLRPPKGAKRVVAPRRQDSNATGTGETSAPNNGVHPTVQPRTKGEGEG